MLIIKSSLYYNQLSIPLFIRIFYFIVHTTTHFSIRDGYQNNYPDWHYLHVKKRDVASQHFSYIDQVRFKIIIFRKKNTTN